MQERVKTSFIPKTSLEVERARPRIENSFALVNTLAGVILVLAIVASAGIFLFERYTIQSIANKKESLRVSREAFQPATIKELVRLNARIETATTLLGEHVALSHLFDDLEERTLASVRFSSFGYEAGPTGDIMLALDGSAATYNAVALQSVRFGESDVLADPIFENVNINALGSVTFNFTGVVSRAELGYREVQSATPADAPAALPASGQPQP